MNTDLIRFGEGRPLCTTERIFQPVGNSRRARTNLIAARFVFSRSAVTVLSRPGKPLGVKQETVVETSFLWFLVYGAFAFKFKIF